MLGKQYPEPSQTEMILEYFKRGGTLTPLEALHKFGCLRLGARVWDLKKRGYDIVEHLVEIEGGKHVAEYRMAIGTPQSPISEKKEEIDVA